MMRFVENLIDGSLFYDLAGVHNGNPVAHRSDNAEVVGNHDNRGSFFLRQLFQKLQNLCLYGLTTAQLQVVLAKPESFEEAKAVADNLNEKRTVVLNLESANRDVARRLVDFLSGVAYANGGQFKRVANSTFIITPYNVDVMGDLLDELENNGMFF